MKNRPLLYLLAVIVVGAGVWFLERPDQGPKDDARLVKFYPQLDPLLIQKLQITRLLEGVTLEKMDGIWTATPTPTDLSKQVTAQGNVPEPSVTPVEADPWTVGAALKTLSALESQSLISRDAATQPQLQVNEVGTRVKAYDAAGQVVADIYIGKTGPDLVSTAVRREGDSGVYLAKGYLGPEFPPTVEKWKKTDEAKPGNEKVVPDKSHPPHNGKPVSGRQ